MDTGRDKIQKICDSLRKETIEPAKQSAQEIVENAHLQAAEIVAEAQKKAEEIIGKGQKELEQKRKIFESTLILASNKTLLDLKQKIEHNLFNSAIKDIVTKESKAPKVIAELINAIISAIAKEGVDVEMSAYIAKSVSPQEVSVFLLKGIMEKLKEKELLIGDFDGGAKVKLHEQELTIDLSSQVLQEVVAKYVREDFRKTLFNS
jgi:V/A-type H+/Na+-transporting ATPase subunit E